MNYAKLTLEKELKILEKVVSDVSKFKGYSESLAIRKQYIKDLKKAINTIEKNN